MRPKAKSKDDIIEELEAENNKLFSECCNLKPHIIKLEGRNEDLRQKLLEARERYADLLERYINTMEGMARIDERTQEDRQ